MTGAFGKIARREFVRFVAGSPLFQALAQEPPIIGTPAAAVNVWDFEAAARKAIPPAHFGYLSTGVDDDRTLAANHEAYNRILLRPRRLIDVSRVDTSVELFGTRWPFPIFLCPCGSQRAFHADGEAGTARAAATRKTLMVLSTNTTTGVEDVSRAAGNPVWFQLYPTTNWAVTEKLIHRAEAAGCPALVITVDSPGARNTETEARFRSRDSRECKMCHPAGGWTGRKSMFDGIDTKGLHLLTPSFTWESVRRVRQITKMKVLLKGIVTAADTRVAMDYGVDGIFVSNHGGRSEESGQGTIECLPEIVDATGGRAPVLIDGGIRRGTDVFKALALGAHAAGIGRPYLWGLGAFGQPGVERVIDILRRELEIVMKQCGAPSIPDIKSSHVSRGQRA